MTQVIKMLDCPTCGARPGLPCVNPETGKRKSVSHDTRPFCIEENGLSEEQEAIIEDMAAAWAASRKYRESFLIDVMRLLSAPRRVPEPEAEPWTVRLSDEQDPDYGDGSTWEVLLPNGEWRGVVAVDEDDARGTVRKEWDEAHPEPEPMVTVIHRITADGATTTLKLGERLITKTWEADPDGVSFTLVSDLDWEEEPDLPPEVHRAVESVGHLDVCSLLREGWKP